MKKKFKFIFASLSIGMLFLSSCEKDMYGEATRKQIDRSDFVINRKSFDQLNKESKFNSAYKKINSEIQNRKLSNKTVMEEMYNFTIDSTQINEVLTEKYTSYSFGIIRDSINPNYYENLFIEIDSTDAPQASILKFNINPNTKEIISISSKLIQYNISQTGKIYYTPPCDYVTVTTETQCACAGHWPGESCTCSQGPTSSTQTYLVCQEDSGGSGDTWTNTSSESGGGGSGGTSVSAPRVLTPKEQRIKNFKLQLTLEQKNCLNSLNETKQGELMNFLESDMDIDGLISSETSYSAEDIQFAEDALQTLCNGGDVDFTLQIILDPSFKNNPCLKGVYDTMIQNSPTANNYLNNFDSTMSVANLMFASSNTLSPASNAVTSPPQNYLISITFNSNNLNRPQLSIARTFIHELIHAEIFRKLLSISNHPSINLTLSELYQNKENFPGLYDYYSRYTLNTIQLSDPQHQMMAQHYRDIISDAIKEFDNNQHSQDVYDALAWVGLMGEGSINMTTGLTSNPTVAWQNLTQTQRINIINTVTTFESSNTNCQ